MNTINIEPHFTTLHFLKGFKYKDRMFGFKDKKLYRLPYVFNNRNYPLKEIEYKKKHYRVCRDKLSLSVIKPKIENIDIVIKILDKQSDCPF